MENFNDLFNLTADDFKEEKKERVSDRYNPQAKDGDGNTYVAVVRFLPWYKDPKHSEKQKRVCWLENLSTGDKRYIDCPSSVGKKDPINDLFWKLKNSQSAKDVELSKMFSSTQKFASLIQVVKDKQHPELEGKIMVWQYGIKIHQKIQAATQPEYGTPMIPFDLFNGCPMQLKISLVSGFNNFDQCQFLNQAMPIEIDGEKMTPTKECQAKLIEWLKTNSPDLDKYGYQEWDAETEAFVKSAIQAAKPGERVMSEISNSAAKQTAPAEPAREIKTSAPAKEEAKDDFNIDDIDFNEELSDDDLYAKL